MMAPFQNLINLTTKFIDSRKANMGTNSVNWHSVLDSDQWVALPVSGQRPSARYKHAAVIADEKLYIVGGSRNGRYLSDVQAFDLKNLTWSKVKLTTKSDTETDVFPSVSGHSMVKWGNKLIFLGGHSTDISDNVTVRFIDLESHLCGKMETTGKVPEARGGQSVSLVGSKLIMFGGEDKKRQLMNDVHVLDLNTFTWTVLETIQTPPSPRFDHTAAVHANRYLLIFGGCSHSMFFNDLHVLDLETLEWSNPQIQGDLVSPRAGHAAVSIDKNWFIVGGGDNKSGAIETLVMDISKLVISTLTNVKERDPLASEGLTVSSAVIDNEHYLVAFGGYNGKYNNEVFVMRPKPKDSKHPKIFQSPAAAAAAASVTAAYALAKSESLEFTTTMESKPKVDLSVEVNIIKGEKKYLESSITEVKSINSSLMEKLEECNGAGIDLSKELHSVKGQLASERSRCSDLEAQILDLKKKLSSKKSIEEEVEALRSEKSAIDQDLEISGTDEKQDSGGVWRWIAG
ncbi:hypothetical protein LXL04_012905 [Taraxacum kok-saghyz]